MKKRKWTIDLNAATATSLDGWVFLFEESEDEEALEAECLAYPEKFSEKEAINAAEAIATDAGRAFMEALVASEAITVENDGQDVRSTDFWDSTLAKEGYLFVSISDGAIRMLLPPSTEGEYLPEMRTGKSVLIEPSMDHDHSLDFVFDDGSDTPFWVVVNRQLVDAKIPIGSNIPFYVYTQEGKQLVLEAKNGLPPQKAPKKKK